MYPPQKSHKTFETILQSYLGKTPDGINFPRRNFIRTLATSSLAAALPSCGQEELAIKSPPNTAPNNSRLLNFKEIDHVITDTVSAPKDYQIQVLVRWGDPIFADSEPFTPSAQTETSQLGQFGFNNDFIGFLPLPLGSNSSSHGLLVVNHEYTNSRMMFPKSPWGIELSLEQTKIDIAAHGLSIIEIKQENNYWRIIKDSPYNKRITPNSRMMMTGPAAKNSRLKTLFSNDGITTFGTYGNCAGGVTPWGTVLTAEENVDYYFSGKISHTPELESYSRFGMKTNTKTWGKYFDRWNLSKNPQEPMHMGWIVEIDPYNPAAIPQKRTALGRFKHEGCNIHINHDGKVIAYSGDDQRFEYIYRFVSSGTYSKDNRENNLSLLDEGILYVARFSDSGELNWLPLIFGSAPLNQDNGFRDQGDVNIDARKAADLMGATPMDRPEDIEVNPNNGRVYAMLTNNTKRSKDQLNLANPRPHNSHGQIIEFWPSNGDHTSDTFKWDLFLLAGDPKKHLTKYNQNMSASGWLSCPDNCAFDNKGNLWIATDGAEKSGISDGLWATEVSGPNKALTKRFLATPRGAELCGPFFTPDNKNLFLSIQHPGEGSTFETPKTRWPDFDKKIPPRPSVIVISRSDEGLIGS